MISPTTPNDTRLPEDPDRDDREIIEDESGEGRRSSTWWWAGGLAVVLATGPYFWLTSRRPTPQPPAVNAPAAAPKLDFKAVREDGDWRLAWNRDAVGGLDPIGAMLTIRDGGADRTQFLDPVDLGSGFILYVAQTSDLVFTLKVTGAKGEIEERVRVLGAERSAGPSPESEAPPLRTGIATRVAGAAKRSDLPAPAGQPVVSPAARVPTSAAGRAAEQPVVSPAGRVAANPAGQPVVSPAGRVAATGAAANPAPQIEPSPSRMIAAAWPGGVPRRVPVEVRIHVWVDATGKVTRAAPAEGGTANDAFVKSALSAARLWRFAPAMTNGRAVPGESVVTFQFKP